MDRCIKKNTSGASCPSDMFVFIYFWGDRLGFLRHEFHPGKPNPWSWVHYPGKTEALGTLLLLHSTLLRPVLTWVQILTMELLTLLGIGTRNGRGHLELTPRASCVDQTPAVRIYYGLPTIILSHMIINYIGHFCHFREIAYLIARTELHAILI